MKHLYTLFTLFIVSSALSQTKEEKIINIVINTESFTKQLSKQEIFDLNQVDYILPNKYTDTTWQLFFANKKIEFNNELNKAVGFDRGYDFEIINFRRKRKKASISMKFYPSFLPCPNGKGSYIGQWHGLYLLVDAELIREKGNWNIVIFNISDESFDTNKDKEPCICNKYVRYVK